MIIYLSIYIHLIFDYTCLYSVFLFEPICLKQRNCNGTVTEVHYYYVDAYFNCLFNRKHLITCEDFTLKKDLCMFSIDIHFLLLLGQGESEMSTLLLAESSASNSPFQSVFVWQGVQELFVSSPVNIIHGSPSCHIKKGFFYPVDIDVH